MKTKPNDNTPARDFNRANSYKSAPLLVTVGMVGAIYRRSHEVG